MRGLTLLLLLLSIMSQVAATDYRTGLINGAEVWQGEVHVLGTVTVTKDAKLLIKAGSRVYFSTEQKKQGRLVVDGQLLIQGEKGNNVVLTGEPRRRNLFLRIFNLGAEKKQKYWGGIVFNKVKPGSLITYAALSQAETGILVSGSDVELTNLKLYDNRIAIKMEERSSGMIQNCELDANEQAVLCLKEASPLIVNNTFTGNRKAAVMCIQAAPDKIKANLFQKNGQGIVARYPGANPVIEDNEFAECSKAIVVAQNAAPRIINNRFYDNGFAVTAVKKSSPLIQANQFKDNDTAIFLNQGSNANVIYNNFHNSKQQALLINNSSYPAIANNNFNGNNIDVRLGEHQSAAYEEVLRKGGAKRAENQSSYKSRSPRRFKSSVEQPLAGFVDARNNYWGESNNKVAAKKDDINLGNIIDYYDVPYRFYGDTEYLQDKVEVLPALPAPAQIPLSEVQK